MFKLKLSPPKKKSKVGGHNLEPCAIQPKYYSYDVTATKAYYGGIGFDSKVNVENGSVLVLSFTGVGRCKSLKLDPCRINFLHEFYPRNHEKINSVCVCYIHKYQRYLTMQIDQQNRDFDGDTLTFLLLCCHLICGCHIVRN